MALLMQTFPVTVSPGLYDAASKTTASPLCDQELPMITSNRDYMKDLCVVSFMPSIQLGALLLAFCNRYSASGTSANEKCGVQETAAEIRYLEHSQEAL